jgi:hypothetical protein
VLVDMDRQWIGSVRAQAELGVTSRPVDETLRDEASWFRQHGLIPTDLVSVDVNSFDNAVTRFPLHGGVTGFWRAAPVALMSGGVMMAAGYLLRTVGSQTAGLTTVPGGMLIIVAFALVRRRQPTQPGSTLEAPAIPRARTALHVLRNFGLTDHLSLGSRFVVLTLTMAAGAVMVLAGYLLAAQAWPLAATLAVIGGLLISGAFVAVARALNHGQRPGGLAV